MLIRKPADILPSEITGRLVRENRRRCRYAGTYLGVRLTSRKR